MTSLELEEKYKQLFPIRGIETNEGWVELIGKFLMELSNDPVFKGLTLFCIKEKFGFLTIQAEYIPTDMSREAFNALCDKYVKLAMSVCKVCGVAMERDLSRGGWASSLCEEHKLSPGIW